MAALVQGHSESTARGASIASPRSVATFFLPQETVFDLGVDLMQPLLGAPSAILIRRNFSFQLRNAIFGSAKLVCELLRMARDKGYGWPQSLMLVYMA